MIYTARLPLFPMTTTVADTAAGPQLAVAGCSLADLAHRFGTPLYVYDRATLDAAVDEYQAALARHYPGPGGLTYAGKAGLCLALAQWAGGRGLTVDCTGVGEIHVAAEADLPRAQVLVHGVNKSPRDVAAAVEHAGVIVVDNLAELARLAELLPEGRPAPDLWLRLRPGAAVETHAYRQTGHEDSKFGMGRDEALEAVRFCHSRGLPLAGLHFHQGSQFRDPTPLAAGLDAALDVAAAARDATGWTPSVVSPGGGWGIAYTQDELPHPAVDDYVAFVAARLVAGCRARGLPLPELRLEPGRTLVARAGVALYTVGAVKQTAHRRWLLVDGGMADNIRPALYGVRYSALPVVAPQRPPAATYAVAGPFCESGDVLIEELALPEMAAGEWLAVPASGAYHLSMASNYNGALKPAVVWLDRGEAHLIRRRETVEEVMARDLPLRLSART